MPFYAILRSIPNKLGGILAMFLAIIFVMLIPFISIIIREIGKLSPREGITLGPKGEKEIGTFSTNKDAPGILAFLNLIFQRSSNGSSFNMVYIYMFKESKYLFWSFISIFLLLGVIGGKPVEEPYASVGLIGTVIYFILLLIFPLFNIVEYYRFKQISKRNL